MVEAVSYQIHTVLTDNGIQFCHPPRYRSGPTAQYSKHLFDRVCRDGYNHARRLKTLRGLTPYEYVYATWTKEPDRFRINPSHHIPGPYT